MPVAQRKVSTLKPEEVMKSTSSAFNLLKGGGGSSLEQSTASISPSGAARGGGGSHAGTTSPDSPTTSWGKLRAKKGGALRVTKENKEMQTESSIYPDTIPSLGDHYTNLASQEFDALKQLRGRIAEVMTEVGGSVYDLFSLKDIMLAMKANLPGAPLTDMLLISAKMFRRTSELSRLLNAFFNITFADDFLDEHMHFTEIRHLKKEMGKVKDSLDVVTKERDMYKTQLEQLKASSKDHVQIVETLEDRNEELETKTASLEDQMALLFHQLTEDFLFYNEAALQRTSEDVDVHEKLAPVRSNFGQSLDAVQARLKFFQGILGEIQEDSTGGGAVGEAHGVKAKLRALDVHVNHIATRFGSVKEGLSQTAGELTSALLEKKKILNFSVHHLRAYEVQNSKLRSARSSMHSLRQSLTRLEKAVSQTFTSGVVLKVDRSGNIEILSEPGKEDRLPARRGGGGVNTEGGEGGATQGRTKRYAVNHISALHGMVEAMSEAALDMTSQLSTDEEHKALMRTLCSSVPSSGRDASSGQAMKDKANAIASAGQQVRMNRILQGIGGAASPAGSAAAGATGGVVSPGLSETGSGLVGSGGAVATGGGGGGGSEVSVEQYQKAREDFSTKLTFLREVYEERINDLETKVERLQKKLHQAEHSVIQAQSAQFKTQIALQQSQLGGNPQGGSGDDSGTGGESGDENIHHGGGVVANMTSPSSLSLLSGEGPLGGGATAASMAEMGMPLQSAEKIEKDEDMADRVKEKWMETKDNMYESEKQPKHSSLARLNELQSQLTEDGQTVAGKSYVSPLYTQSLMSKGGGKAKSAGGGGGITSSGGTTTTAGELVTIGVPVLGNIVAPSGALRTSHSRNQQDKNAQVLRTLRQLAQLPQKDDPPGDEEGAGARGGVKPPHPPTNSS